jgi:hypothetical protein
MRTAGANNINGLDDGYTGANKRNQLYRYERAHSRGLDGRDE